jgi:orotidine-5'-phosphate decarboxylase
MLNHPFYQKVKANIQSKKTFICLGLDPDIEKIPDHFDKNIQGLELFLFDVIEATKDLCIAYKPNISFFEALGIDGLRLLEKVRKKIPDNIPVILDAKRGDIGNTSKMQARYIFDYFGADATTLSPYMGLESLQPFFDYKDKYHFVLTLTSNPGAKQFEKHNLDNGQPLYVKVAQACQETGNKDHNIGLVVGATQKEVIELRKIVPNLVFLIPGVGQQGGSYEDAVKHGTNIDNVAVINVSRSILYCSRNLDFTTKIQEKFLDYLI